MAATTPTTKPINNNNKTKNNKTKRAKPPIQSLQTHQVLDSKTKQKQNEQENVRKFKPVRPPLSRSKSEELSRNNKKERVGMRINEKLHRVFNEYNNLKNKNKIINNEDEMDQKLDPEAPAYIPNIATSPWSSSSSLVNV